VQKNKDVFVHNSFLKIFLSIKHTQKLMKYFIEFEKERNRIEDYNLIIYLTFSINLCLFDNQSIHIITHFFSVSHVILDVHACSRRKKRSIIKLD